MWYFLFFIVLLVVVMVATGILLGMGFLISLVTPLTLFQASILTTGAMACLLLLFIAIFITETVSKEGVIKTGTKESKSRGRYKDIARKIQNSPCPCGSGKKMKDCCGG